MAKSMEPGPDLRALYRTHRRFIERSLQRFGVTPERLEDATQEVFLTAHRRWSTFARQSSEQTWLFGIAQRVAQNERRSLRRRTARLVPIGDETFWGEVPSPSAGPAELVAKRQAAVLLERGLKVLSENERVLFLLVDVEAVSVPEASRRLGINQNTAYGRLRAARASLRDFFSQEKWP